MVESSVKMWSTGEGNGKPLQYSCLKNPMGENDMYIYVWVPLMFTWNFLNIVDLLYPNIEFKIFLKNTKNTSTLLLKNANHHLSLQQIVNFLLVKCLASMSVATNWLRWWLLKARWLWRVLKIRQKWYLPHWLTLPFVNNFYVAAVLLVCILPTVRFLSKLEPVPSNLAVALSTKFMSFSKSFVIISTDFTASLPGVDSISINHCFCSSTRSNSSFLKVLLWDCDNSVLSSGSTSNSSSPAIATRSAVTSSTSLELLKVIHEGWNQLFQILVHVDILTFSRESQMFLMASRMVNPFQKVFRLFCPHPSEE